VNELALFAGAGGGILGGKLLGWRTVCAVELAPYARAILAERQNDGCLHPFPVWDDITTFDGRPWRGIVDVVSGGFPCQDISVAGKGAGLSGERSGLWGEMRRIIGEVRPHYVFVENSPALTSRGLGTVLGDLAALGYDARWGVLGAVDAGAPHRRDRIWIVANANSVREPQRQGRECDERGRACDGGSDVFDTVRHGCEANHRRELVSDQNRHDSAYEARWKIKQPGLVLSSNFPDSDLSGCQELHAPTIAARAGFHSGHDAPDRGGTWWATEPELGRVADGVANRVDRLRAIGNGQVPTVAALAWRLLSVNPQPATRNLQP